MDEYCVSSMGLYYIGPPAASSGSQFTAEARSVTLSFKIKSVLARRSTKAGGNLHSFCFGADGDHEGDMLLNHLRAGHRRSLGVVLPALVVLALPVAPEDLAAARLRTSNKTKAVDLYS